MAPGILPVMNCGGEDTERVIESFQNARNSFAVPQTPTVKLHQTARLKSEQLFHADFNQKQFVVVNNLCNGAGARCAHTFQRNRRRSRCDIFFVVCCVSLPVLTLGRLCAFNHVGNASRMLVEFEESRNSTQPGTLKKVPVAGFN